MTAQIEDIYKHENKNYTVVARSAGEIFEPEKYGLEPHGRATACYRGYWCDFETVDEELFLNNLYIYNKEDNYPALNGMPVSPAEFWESKKKSKRSKNPEMVKIPAYFGHRMYRNVHLQIPYTGKILLGSEFIQSYYIHMGFQRAWAYETLLELVFDEGLLMECNDLSHMAKEYREYMSEMKLNHRNPEKKDSKCFVEESFSMDYSDKVWWHK